MLNARPEESHLLVQRALVELGLKDLGIKKSVPSSYILAEYKAGWLDKRQIEFSFKDKENKTEVSIKWFYPSSEEYESLFGKGDHAFLKADEQETRHKAERFFEELKSRIGASDILTANEVKTVKEVIKEKEVIVKVRCSYCYNLYDETVDKCPNCGARR